MMKAVFILILLTGVSFQQRGDLDTAMEGNFSFDNFVNDPKGGPDAGPLDGPAMNIDASLFEAVSAKAGPSAGPQTLDHNNLRSDLDFTHDSVPELKQRDFDIEKFLTEFDRIDCTQNNGDPNDPLNLLCESELKKAAFAPLGQFNTDRNSFYNYLKEQIYMPLACDVRKRQNLSDMLVDTLNINDKNSVFNQQPFTANYNAFEGHILDTFEDIAGKTSDMEANKDAINELIISVLKKFHIYWNFLRYKGQFDKLKFDTKEVMRTLLKSYMMKRDFLNYVSKTLIQGIIKAYYRFIRAHKMVELLNKYGPDLMVNQIVTRYKAVGDKIKNNNFSQILIVKEMSYLISLLQVYHILSYKKGAADNVIINNFNTSINYRIQIEYQNYERYLPEDVEHDSLKQIRDFTAILLLKFKHMTFIMFNFHGIAQYANFPQMNYIKSPFAIKIYYELLDNMLLVPKTCTVSFQLKNCVLHETHKTLRYLSTKYNVKRSTYGWYYLQELSTMMKALYSKADATVWENWGQLKTYFYPNLFSVMYTYKKLFMINDMDEVENLENAIGEVLDGRKKDVSVNLDYGLIDNMDKALYEEFLNIKADYNSYSPIQRDATILSYLRSRLIKFFDNFERDNIGKINPAMHDLVERSKKVVTDWVPAVVKAPVVSIGVNNLNTQPTFIMSNTQNGGDKENLGTPTNDSSNYEGPPPNFGQAPFGQNYGQGQLGQNYGNDGGFGNRPIINFSGNGNSQLGNNGPVQFAQGNSINPPSNFASSLGYAPQQQISDNQKPDIIETPLKEEVKEIIEETPISEKETPAAVEKSEPAVESKSEASAPEVSEADQNPSEQHSEGGEHAPEGSENDHDNVSENPTENPTEGQNEEHTEEPVEKAKVAPPKRRSLKVVRGMLGKLDSYNKNLRSRFTKSGSGLSGF